jgi:uncharacterized membrane protein
VDKTTRVLLVVLAAWVFIYTTRALNAHWAFRTNAFDLSVFDYALWSTGRIGLGYVPFMGHSLFSHHFMPTLLALWAPYQLFLSPVFLIAVQIGAFAGAAFLFYRLMPARLPGLARIALIVAFLFGRRSHSALSSFFYVESLEPLLIFGMLLTRQSGRTVLAVLAGALALGCKEDVAIYVAVFGALVLTKDSKRTGIVVTAVCLAWLAFAVGVAVPQARRHDGQPAASPFVEAAAGSSRALTETVRRIATVGVIERVALLTAGTGLLCWLAPRWMVVVISAIFIAIVGNPHTKDIGISGHYVFPILPWMFFAAAIGAVRLHHARPRVLTTISILLLSVTMADSPLWQSIARSSVTPQGIAAASEALERVPRDASVLAMPNLVPHLSHRRHIWTIGGPVSDGEAADYVVISLVGDLWPLDPEDVQAEIAKYKADRQFAVLAGGPLYVFRRAR